MTGFLLSLLCSLALLTPLADGLKRYRDAWYSIEAEVGKIAKTA